MRKILDYTYAGISLGCLAVGLASPAKASENTDGSDIIVTARRVEERLQDVPISITVVDQDRLSTANITSATDLTNVVPGLSVQSRYSSENANFAIRGFSQELRTTASVGAYFAEVVAPRGGGISLSGGDGAGPGSLFDLQNVQVLKGPQGTLFGRNTTGGAVLLVPKKPTDELEGYVEGSYGNFDMLRVQGAINAPLASWARLRLGVDRMTRNGYMPNGAPVGPRNFANVDYVAARASLVLDLAPNVENYTIASYSRSDNNGSPGQIFRFKAGVGFADAIAAPVVARKIASGNPYYTETKMDQARTWTKQWQIINTTKWEATDNITVKNILSYSQFRQILRQDIFSNYNLHPLAGRTLPANQGGFTFPSDLLLMTSYSFSGGAGLSNSQNNLTEELQVQGVSGDGRLNYQFGLYYEHSTPGGPTESISPGTASACSSAGFESIETIRCLPASPFTGNRGTVNNSLSTIKFINMATYGQATYALTEKLKVTGGIRLTWDRTRGHAVGRVLEFDNNGVTAGLGAPNVYGVATFLRCQPDFVQFGASCETPDGFLKTSTTKPTWTLNATYEAAEEALLYASYSRGYRQGSVTPLALTFKRSFEPESVDSFELGVKTRFQGAVSGYVNLAAFYSKIKGQQLQIGLQDNTGQSGTTIFNAGKSRMYGLDIDGSLKFSDVFRVSAALTYVNSRVTELDPTLLTALRAEETSPGVKRWAIVAPNALQGDQLPYSPKLAFNIHPVITLPTSASIGRIEVGATYRHVSAFPTASTSANPSSDVRSTRVSQLDLNLDWKEVGGQPIDISLFATNVTNQFTATLIQPIIDAGFGFDMRYLGPPRMYGVRLRYSFGN
jgi:iron complex outermembrane receptor protein